MSNPSSTSIPSVDSAPRGHNDPDVRSGIWEDQFYTIDEDKVLGDLTARIPEDERARLALPPQSPEYAAQQEALRRLPAELGRIATELTEQEIDRRIVRLVEGSEQSPVTTELGPTQFGLYSAEQARLNAPDGEVRLAEVQPDGSSLTQDEVVAIINKARGASGLTSEAERLRYNEITLSQTMLDRLGNTIPNPYYDPDPMNRAQARINLQAHRTGAVPKAPSRAPQGVQNQISRLSSRLTALRSSKRERLADKARVFTGGPHASQDTYGGGKRLSERRDARAEENLTRNEFSRTGSVFKLYDKNTGKHRHYVIEGAHARQAVWNPNPTIPAVPLYFLCPDGSVGEPVALDEFGNITNRPVAVMGSSSTTQTEAQTASGKTTSLLCDASGKPIHIPKAFEHLEPGATTGKTTGVFRPGSETVIYRPMWTRDEIEDAYRHGIMHLAEPGYSGAPEDLLAPRYTTVDDLVFASALQDHSEGQNTQPRIIRRGREAVLEREFVWKSEEEMTDDEFDHPDQYPPEIVSGRTRTDRGVFVHFLSEDHQGRGATRVEGSLDSHLKMPPQALRGSRRSRVYKQQQTLETRDTRASRRAYKP